MAEIRLAASATVASELLNRLVAVAVEPEPMLDVDEVLAAGWYGAIGCSSKEVTVEGDER